MVRPKIIASTATVRRAENQIQALFNRREVDIFPPPGPDRRDSFFAGTHPAQESHATPLSRARRPGTQPEGRHAAHLPGPAGAAQKAYDADGGKKNQGQRRRSLHDARSATSTACASWAAAAASSRTRSTPGSPATRNRKRVGEADGLFANRNIAYDVVELTSRVPTDQVSEAKRRWRCRSTRRTAWTWRSPPT